MSRLFILDGFTDSDQISFGNIRSFTMDAKCILTHPSVFGLIGMIDIVSWSQLSFPDLLQSESDVFGLVIAVLGQHIEDHPSKQLFCIWIEQLEFLHRLK
jgi:hypothetical protein